MICSRLTRRRRPITFRRRSPRVCRCSVRCWPISSSWRYTGETKSLDTLELAVARSDGALGPQMRPTPHDCATWIASRGRGTILPKPSTPPGYRDCGLQGSQRRHHEHGDADVPTGQPLDPTARQNRARHDWSTRLLRSGSAMDAGEDRARLTSRTWRSPGALATALRNQLGLKLEPGTSSVDLLLIDHVEHPKTE